MIKIKVNYLVWLSIIVSIIPFGLYYCFYGQMSDRIPMHYNAAGQVDRFVDKSSPEILIICALGFFGLGFMKFLEFIFVKASQRNVENIKITRKIMNISAFLVSLLFSGISMYYLWVAMKLISYDMEFVLRLGFLTIGIVLVVVGNFLPKIKQNKFVGFRTKATLRDNSIWFKAQRFASKIWASGGALMVLTLFLPNKLFIFINIFILLSVVIIPLIYVKSKS